MKKAADPVEMYMYACLYCIPCISRENEKYLKGAFYKVGFELPQSKGSTDNLFVLLFIRFAL